MRPLTIAALTLAVAHTACTDVPTSARPAAPSVPSRVISDAPRGGRQHVYFLPPMVSQPTTTGTFDPALSPVVTICRLQAGSCAAVVAQFTSTTSPAVTVDVANGEYRVNWDTKASALDVDLFYRINVWIGSTLIAFADVDPVSGGSGLKSVETGSYIPLVDGRTLPIKFRIETAAIGTIVVSPGAASAAVGASQQFSAQLFDLHGASMTGATVAWSVDAASVATIDAAGLATGVAPGETQVWASAGGVRGGASLTVGPPSGPRTPGLFYTVASGPVTVRFESSASGFTSDAYCNDAAGSLTWVGTSHVTDGTQFSLGNFPVGAEVFCYIYVRNTGYWYYMGPATNNPDGEVHAAVGQRGDGSIFVGFEESFGGGDRDFDDVVLTVSPVTYEPASGP